MWTNQTSLVIKQCHEARAEQGAFWGWVPFPDLLGATALKTEPFHRDVIHLKGSLCS